MAIFLLLVKFMDANLFPKHVPCGIQAEHLEVGIKYVKQPIF